MVDPFSNTFNNSQQKREDKGSYQKIQAVEGEDLYTLIKLS